MNTDTARKQFEEQLSASARQLTAWARKNGFIRKDQMIRLAFRVSMQKKKLALIRQPNPSEWKSIVEIDWTVYQRYLLGEIKKAAFKRRRIKYGDVSVPSHIDGKWAGGPNYGDDKCPSWRTYERINQRLADARLPFAFINHNKRDESVQFGVTSCTFE